MYFVYEFDLIPRKEELAPLQPDALQANARTTDSSVCSPTQELIDRLMERDTQQFAKGAAAAS
eukprot:scaffold95007_cov33-Tisochrysis_lutea.AAC.1